ncbi:hypothetical protein CL652_02565 [bacterium]|nr:hypothetical protein [bacterium]|tara:strand:+ start:14982 stop:15638 length:657 start_codon:yes stop_codon:yes gene_type:complete
MQIPEKRLKELKGLLEKEYGREFSDVEVLEAGNTLCGLAEILYDHWREESRREKKLKESPKGFVLEGVGYTCFICGGGTPANGNWYDKYGIKCSVCQRAINRKEIPASLAKNKESWYTKYDLERSFNLNRYDIKRWVKEEILKARTISREDGGTHVQLFLIKNNRGFLPPKKLVKSRLVKETKDGKDFYHSEPWYRFVDPKEYLKDYKIMDYLEVTRD